MGRAGNVYLVGLMGAGKTTIGRLLAKNLNKTFIDADQELEQRTGVDIPLIFDLEGEAGFRLREARLLEELTQMNNVVLATGGGAVLNSINRRNLQRGGVVIYLRASVSDLLRRTRRDKHRPLLQTENPQDKLQQLLEQRDPLYTEIADIVIESGKQTAQRLVRQLVDKLETIGK